MLKRSLTLSLLAAAVSLGAFAGSAHAHTSIQACSGPSQIPAENQVILYEDIQYGGRCWLITVTEDYMEPWVENQGIPNDLITSVKVGGKTAIVLYEDINNSSPMVLYGDTSNNDLVFVPYVGDAINDKTSSFYIVLTQ
jgi:hypothetical protein